jgi:CheY-like chemotaxis protein
MPPAQVAVPAHRCFRVLLRAGARIILRRGTGATIRAARTLGFRACGQASVAHRNLVGNTVFIIEPSDENRRHLAATMAAVGANVRAFAVADDFLREVSPGDSGCVVVPSHMVGMGICELLGTLRAREIPLPVVVLGSNADLDSAVQAMRAGASDYLEPPVSDRRLRETVRVFIGPDRAS